MERRTSERGGYAEVLKERLRDAEAVLNREIGRREVLRERKAQAERELADARAERETCVGATVFLGKCAEATLAEVSAHLENVVSMALRHVFDDSFYFTVEWVRNGKTTGVQFKVHSRYGEGEIADDPRDARGGGVQNVVGFALWITLLYLTGHSGPILLDEPFHWLSGDHNDAMSGFLRAVQEDLGWQVLIVNSHVNPDVARETADTVFRVRKNVEGRSWVEVLE